MPTTTRQFDVTGMTCGGCERALERAVGRVVGVEKVAASHADQSATITFDDDRVTPDQLADAIRSAGYTPSNAPST